MRNLVLFGLVLMVAGLALPIDLLEFEILSGYPFRTAQLTRDSCFVAIINDHSMFPSGDRLIKISQEGELLWERDLDIHGIEAFVELWDNKTLIVTFYGGSGEEPGSHRTVLLMDEHYEIIDTLEFDYIGDYYDVSYSMYYDSLGLHVFSIDYCSPDHATPYYQLYNRDMTLDTSFALPFEGYTSHLSRYNIYAIPSLYDDEVFVIFSGHYRPTLIFKMLGTSLTGAETHILSLDNLRGLNETPDGGLLLTGRCTSTSRSRLLKLDRNLDLVYDRVLGDYCCYPAAAFEDGSYIIGAIDTSYSRQRILKYNADGELIGRLTLLERAHIPFYWFSNTYHVNKKAVHGYYDIPGPRTFFFGYIDHETVFEGIKEDEPIQIQRDLFSVFPNPMHSTDELRITLHEPASEFTVSLFDIEGRLVAHKTGGKSLNLQSRDIRDGIYLITVQSAEYKQTKKIAIIN